jgi:hypothetical protein
MGLYYKETEDDKQCLFVKLNERAVNLKDMEKLMKELWLLRKNVVAYQVLNRKQRSSNYLCHPLRVLKKYWDEDRVQEIMDLCVDSVTAMAESDLIIPEYFLMEGEELNKPQRETDIESQHSGSSTNFSTETEYEFESDGEWEEPNERDVNEYKTDHGGDDCSVFQHTYVATDYYLDRDYNIETEEKEAYGTAGETIISSPKSLGKNKEGESCLSSEGKNAELAAQESPLQHGQGRGGQHEQESTGTSSPETKILITNLDMLPAWEAAEKAAGNDPKADDEQPK